MAALRAYGVSRVIDLRASWEMAAGEHPLMADPMYRLVPFIDEIRDKERDPASERSYADLYRGSLERNGRQVARVAAAIANAPAGAVVVHCVAGADRTGMLVALVLDLIGVDRAAIMADYARTRECLAQSGSSAAPPSAPSNGLRDDGPPTILAALDYLDEHFVGSRNYLLRGGMTIGDMDRLRARLRA